MDRTFTLSEAQKLLPVLESLLRTSMTAKKRIEEIDADLQKISHRIFLMGGVMLNPFRLKALKEERERHIQRAQDAVAEIHATGVQVKDLDIGLLDFPCTVEGKTILLCWKLGERKIAHWHGTDEGYVGRKLINAKIANAGK